MQIPPHHRAPMVPLDSLLRSDDCTSLLRISEHQHCSEEPKLFIELNNQKIDFQDYFICTPENIKIVQLTRCTIHIT